MKKRMNIVAASMAVVLGLAGCKNKETGQATTAPTTAEMTEAAIGTQAVTQTDETAQAPSETAKNNTVDRILSFNSIPEIVVVEYGSDVILKCSEMEEENPAYRWQRRKGNEEWINAMNIGAETNALTLTMSAALDGYQYRCRTTDADGNVKFSNTVYLVSETGTPLTDDYFSAGVRMEVSHYDSDNNGLLSPAECSHVKELSFIPKIHRDYGVTDPALSNKIAYQYTDLTGIEYFNNLESLTCPDNSLTDLDLSNFPNLKYLTCSGNQLAELDVSHNTKLNMLDCSQNNLQELDLSQNICLEDLNCSNNQLKSLDLSANKSLKGVYCHLNQLTSLKMYTGEFCGIVVDHGVDISGNENGFTTTFLTNDKVVKTDPVTGAATYPDGEYGCVFIGFDPEYNIKKMESAAEGWCTAARVENGYLYIDGYMSYYFDTSDHEGRIWYIGDGHLCLPLAENVKYYSCDEDAYEVTQDDVIYGPSIYAEIKDGVVVKVSCSA